MNRLTKDALKASGRFLHAQARPLEKARYNYAFGNGSPEAVLEALAKYQNDDGGFGHALEPDLRAPESSALCTTIALQLFRELGTPADHPMMSSVVAFFVKTFDEVRRHWRIIPEEAERSPRAPWWDQADRMERFEGFSLNPTAEILGCLFDCRQQVPEEMITLTSTQVLAELNRIDQIEMHDLLCCLRLFRTDSLPTDYRQQVEIRLRQLIGKTVARDSEAWKGYSLRPLQVANDPESPFTQGLEDAVAANLDYEIFTQNTDGSWTPTWSWDNAYPGEWEKAKIEWAGVITIEKLLTLKNFKRIASVR